VRKAQGLSSEFDRNFAAIVEGLTKACEYKTEQEDVSQQNIEPFLVTARIRSKMGNPEFNSY
jgi:hypothetical protein